MNTNGENNKVTITTESPVSVKDIPASTKNKILHKYDKYCLKFGI